MRKYLYVLMIWGLALLGAGVAAAGNLPQPPLAGGYPPGYVYPPRFQIYQAPEPYGGLVMLDTQTGQTYQRVVVSTPQGIRIRWMKVERKPPQKGEKILWK